jgi:hypothetical protein
MDETDFVFREGVGRLRGVDALGSAKVMLLRLSHGIGECNLKKFLSHGS